MIEVCNTNYLEAGDWTRCTESSEPAFRDDCNTKLIRWKDKATGKYRYVTVCGDIHHALSGYIKLGAEFIMLTEPILES